MSGETCKDMMARLRREMMTVDLEGVMQTGSSQDASPMECPMMKRRGTRP